MKNLKWLWYLIIAILFLLVTFFGMGPVLFADGSSGERIITLLVVVLLYIALAVIFLRIKKQGK